MPDAGGVNEHVVLRPPVSLVRPKRVAAIPEETGIRGGAWYEPKLDGYRAVAWCLPGGVRLHSRAGLDLTAMVPEVAGALERLPVGAVLDGELCAVVGGRMEFGALARRRSRDRSRWPAVSYAVFDVLAVPGRDLRALPLRKRQEELRTLLEGSEPPVQLLFGTAEKAVAEVWFREMGAVGSEGIVAKPLGSVYEPRRAGWVKVRHSETADAKLVGVVGGTARPEAVVVDLPDGRRAVTSPRLGSADARVVGGHVAGDVGSEARMLGEVLWHPVGRDLLIEVREESGRHGAVRFVRVREDEEGAPG
ncbi:DNA ligase [Streptomyces sp. Ru87]|uniref:ATP-dependent DNA ligase n=1 Tax=Streptomyces sp. Ru87 TaxID=2044307 RepID=UPI000BF635CF|nr:DNA ligase [Streptomyces sp. Ru87]PGH48374.1 DNA ligase [Streptomyces sp. Ru87]